MRGVGRDKERQKEREWRKGLNMKVKEEESDGKEEQS